jgi:AcrR family transcriptional regulator
MGVSEATALRADAQRNLERILAAAREAFAERGFNVGVEEIARRAGVGKATLFRRFPSKDALILAVLDGFVADMERVSRRALELDNPWHGLRLYLTEHARMQSDNAGFFDAIASRWGPAFIPEDIPARTLATAEAVLAPARRAGLIREGVGAGDITAMLKMLGTAVRPAPHLRIGESSWQRYVELLLSGIRPGQEPLPGVPMDPCAVVRETNARAA